jgi:FixJ family two-component response regulator
MALLRCAAQPQPAILEPRESTMPVISIIDDDESVRESAMDLFKSMGFVAVAYPCAADFLSSNHLHATSCLIAEVQMPEMTRLELHNRLVGREKSFPRF